jgi:aldose 1-epimerase
VGSKETRTFAELTGQFHLGEDLPEALGCWPSDFILNVTYRLERDRLRVQARLENSGSAILPFGLGYHPYFRLPGVKEETIDGCILYANVNLLWETEQNLPTGKRIAIPGDIDFQIPHRIASVALDNVFTDVRTDSVGPDGMNDLAALSHRYVPGRLHVRADPAFRELVLFIPPHRQAVAIEPYTCAADAANLASRGIDSGQFMLAPSGRWDSVVEYRWYENEGGSL